jgi:hypothetical protein
MDIAALKRSIGDRAGGHWEPEDFSKARES